MRNSGSLNDTDHALRLYDPESKPPLDMESFRSSGTSDRSRAARMCLALSRTARSAGSNGPVKQARDVRVFEGPWESVGHGTAQWR
jgi:hypothetical protein